MKRKKSKLKGQVKYKIDIFKDSETNQYTGIAQGLNYSGYGLTIDEAIKNTNISVEMALEWCVENGTFEDVLKESGFELRTENDKPIWEQKSYVGSFESSIAA
ncbi:MAG: hypothetical protein A3I68_08405 [Candidatus Melainabacteria bacterium RIFCSPLOWO2_02_FULL_35_15]|nr:MAG: hypothetical protein A3F80_08630 [Candidatus Melainabacteria bacterium RIFCSPLOWO2_12_FULL_35_11]OGI13992.1 MAG: hypothetical protein A3I68_08405 [Candidatus Melainabacteria bacterium RIFCSPLOWO2_02_FULL_35_15]